MEGSPDIIEFSPKTEKIPKESNEFHETVKNIILDKKKTLRTITSTKKWDLEETDYFIENQIDKLKQIMENLETPKKHNQKTKLFISEINNKINSYKNQDIHKNIYSENLSIPFHKVIESLLASNLKCYYCRENVNIIYKSVRDMKQWTLERIDNKQGHNTDNVEIACLSCNLQRRTMYHERFLFTKQMGIIKKID